MSLRSVFAWLTAAALVSLGVWYYNAVPAHIEAGNVKLFLVQDYFAMAPKNPKRALADLTTDNFRALQVGDSPPFVPFWTSVQKVSDVNVQDISSVKNVFVVQWTMTYKKSRTPRGTPRRELGITCEGWQRWVPLTYLVKCPVGNLRLDSQYASGAGTGQ